MKKGRKIALQLLVLLGIPIVGIYAQVFYFGLIYSQNASEIWYYLFFLIVPIAVGISYLIALRMAKKSGTYLPLQYVAGAIALYQLYLVVATLFGKGDYMGHSVMWIRSIIMIAESAIVLYITPKEGVVADAEQKKDELK